MKLEKITEQIADAMVAQLVATPYLQGIDESWRESSDPAGQIGPDSAHLVFVVLVKDSPVTGQTRGAPGDILRCASAVDVTFDYHVRLDQQIEDVRLAKRAAREVLTLVNQETAWEAEEDVVVTVRQRFSPIYLLDTEPYVRVTVGFTIEHDEEI